VGHKKDKTPLIQITTLDQDSQDLILLTNRDDLEDAILRRNQQHTRSALVTPFASDNALKALIDPSNPDNKIDSILSGTFIEANPTISPTDVEKEWIRDLKIKLTNTIDINVTTDDFISFFKRRKEQTASSISGHHLGHYKTLAIAGQQGIICFAETITTLINISIITSNPLRRWQNCAQIMLDKGKGHFIDNLRIIQLCEVDLNFILHILWGNGSFTMLNDIRPSILANILSPA